MGHTRSDGIFELFDLHAVSEDKIGFGASRREDDTGAIQQLDVLVYMNFLFVTKKINKLNINKR